MSVKSVSIWRSYRQEYGGSIFDKVYFSLLLLLVFSADNTYVDVTDRQVSHKSLPVCVGSVSEELPRLYVQLIDSVDAT